MASKKILVGKPKSQPTTAKVFTITREQESQRPAKVFTREVKKPMQIQRGQQNILYQVIGDNFVIDHADEIPGADHLLKGRGCLEQLGRMIVNDVEAATVLEAAKNAADALNAGGTVKQVEAYLRHGRITGEWNEALLTATKEAATNMARPVKGLNPADLIAIETLLRDSASLYDILGDVNPKGKPAERRNARMAEMYADKVKSAFEAMTGHTFPQPTGDTIQ